MQPVVLDTDVASLSHRRRLPGPLAARVMGRRPLITFVTLGELVKWMELRRWGTRSRLDRPAASRETKRMIGGDHLSIQLTWTGQRRGADGLRLQVWVLGG